MDILNDCFDKIYVINVNTNAERRALVGKELSHLEFEFFEAVVPNRCSKKTQQRLGNKLSHIGCIEKAKNLGFKNVLVLEDDVIFDEAINYRHLMGSAKEFIDRNDWACFYLGGKSRIDLRHTGYVAPFVKTACGMIGTHAIAYNSNYYDCIIDYLHKAKFDYPIDYCFAGGPNIKDGFCDHSDACYTVYPKFILQRTGQNIQSVEVSINYWRDY